MDKQALLSQVLERLKTTLGNAVRSARDSREAAAHVATEEEKRADSRVGLEFGALATGHEKRTEQLKRELDALTTMRMRKLGQRDAVELGAVVEVEDEACGEGKTFFLLPVGSVSEISGPDGDGVLTVISAASPMGRAVLGKRVGDEVEVMTRDDVRDWRITFVT